MMQTPLAKLGAFLGLDLTEYVCVHASEVRDADPVLPNDRPMLVYGLAPGNEQVARRLTGGVITGVEKAGTADAYEVAATVDREICGPFAGMTVANSGRGGDSVLLCHPGRRKEVREVITLGGRPMLAVVGNVVLLSAAAPVVDLDEETEARIVPEALFSRFVAYVMALRMVAGGNRCFRPDLLQACVIVDDPQLHNRYGHLNLAALPEFTGRNKLHLSIAFIPHNWRTSARRISRLFRENAERLSICFHGNDHTRGEFASTDAGFLEYAVSTAEARMRRHTERTAVPCGKVMVFPQGRFSVEAMQVLEAHRFLAAINTVPYPVQEPQKLTWREIASPAVLRYASFPLFLRKPAAEWQPFDVAVCLFFGRPVIVVEHHQIGRNMEALAKLASLVNRIAPEVRWCDPETLVKGAYLRRSSRQGTVDHVLAFGNAVRIVETATAEVELEWASRPGAASAVRVSSAEEEHQVPWDNKRELPLSNRPGLMWCFKAVLRRRACDFRDNYVALLKK